MNRLSRRSFLRMSAGTATGLWLAGCTPIQAPLQAPTFVASPATPAGPAAALSDVTLTILFDNSAADSQFRAGWGLAALVEYGGHTLLFDTGDDGSIFMENMRQLDIDPQAIEAVIFSHEHDDHTNGLQALLDSGVRPTVYAPVTFTKAFKDGVKAQTELVEVTKAMEMLPGMHLVGAFSVPEELALALETAQGTVLMTGCAHPGIATVVGLAQEVLPGNIALLAGGFHLMDWPAAKVQAVIAQLRELGVERVLPTHCTGYSAIELFRTEYGENCLEGGAGRIVSSSAW